MFYVVSATLFAHLCFQVDIYQEDNTMNDYVSLCNCLQALNDSASVSTLLNDLLAKEDEHRCLLAYQVAFDLCENENQKFSLEIVQGLPTNPFLATPTPTAAATEETAADTATALSEAQMMANIDASRAELDGTDTTTTTTTTTEAAAAVAAAPYPQEHAYWSQLSTLKAILGGGLSTRLYLQFLYKHNHADLILLKNLKDKCPERNSVCHGALVTAHSYMHCGTTVDKFLRTNLEWLSKASNWNKFNAIASMGVVYKGHLAESKTLLEPYLPTDASTSTRPYQEGGALMALGLIHANNNDDAIVGYIMNHLQQASIHPTEQTSEILQSGACFGVGLSAMGTGSLDIFEKLKTVLYTDRAVAGEAAGIAMGLLLLGNPKTGPLEDMLRYAHDTKHDKIIRGLGLGISLTMLGQEEQADALISRLSKDNDFILRVGAMWTVASAYAGTTNNSAIRRLLHVAVSDVNDDVRRTAVMALGFVMLRAPAQVPKLVSLLSESYNPHVRYGSCMAIGVACAGTANQDALDLLLPMLKDKESFVRQGALMASALVLMQENEQRCTHVKALRATIEEIAGDKRESIIAKFGAVVAAGILDAGGRNMCVALTSRTGFLRRGAVVGMMVWLNHWFWHPLLNFFSLALTPTAIIGVNKDMKMPEKFTLQCGARPSLFAYPKALEEQKEEKKERVKTVVLSTTAKAKAKAKAKAGGDEDGDTTMQEAAAVAAVAAVAEEAKKKQEEEEGEKKKEDEKKKEAAVVEEKEAEPESFTMPNPSRVTYAQYAFVTPDENNRYRPIIANKRNLGVVVLTDSTPEIEDEALMDIEAPPKGGEEAEEPPCPEPFDWIPPEFKQ